MAKTFASSALYTAAQLREIDRLAIAAGTPGIVLMRRAAESAWRIAAAGLPRGGKVTVLCGAGNNGGDGYLLARAAHASGAEVRVFAFAEPRGDAATARDALCDDGVQVEPCGALDAVALATADLVVDALLGTGAAGPPRDSYASAISLLNLHCSGSVLSLDLPSGICADSGRLLGDEAVRADLTVTFIGLKRGLFTDAACEHTGALHLATLDVDCDGIPVAAAASLCDFEALFAQLPARQANHYKNRSGHVLVIGGDHGMAGAPLLAGTAAMYCGAGLVSVATRPAHVAAVVAARPELMVHGIEKAVDLQPLIDRADLLLLGPGLGQSDWSQQMLRCAADAGKPMVVDADALNLAARNQALRPRGELVLTPHPGEARRLAQGFGLHADLDRFALAQGLRQKIGQTIVLKGAGTIVAHGDRSVLCHHGHPVLGTAGSGDVLGGLLAALWAQGMQRAAAAELAVCLHALAGERWASRNDERGMLAGELAPQLRELLNGKGPEIYDRQGDAGKPRCHD